MPKFAKKTTKKPKHYPSHLLRDFQINLIHNLWIKFGINSFENIRNSTSLRNKC